MQGKTTTTVEIHHDFAAALSLKRLHTLTCSFHETINMFVACVSFDARRVEIPMVSCQRTAPCLFAPACT
jgi:hypothetical protein